MVTGIPLLLLIGVSVILIILLIVRWNIHPVLSLILASFFLGISVGMPLLNVVSSIEEGFGSLMKYIGLIVVFGSIIGVYLEKSGGAMTIARYIVDLVGKGRSVTAISIIGAVVSIPVFCDSGFILLSGLSKKLSRISNSSKASLSLALATGLYTTHTLVPPTPGPIAAAGNIGASDYLGTIIIIGLLISIIVLVITQFLARKLGKNIVIEESQTEEKIMDHYPSLAKSLLPVLIPILLIALGTISRFTGISDSFIGFISAPIVSILIGALLAVVLLGPDNGKSSLQWLESSVKIAGPILIITGAGGAFGGVLKATPLAEFVGQWLTTGNTSSLVILILVFTIAAVLKTAQGSSTSAMVITSSLLAPLVPALGWETPLDLSLAVLAIGGGAMTVSHYNDSYFWVVSQFSGMSTKDTNKTFTLITGIQGIIVLILVLLIAAVI